MSPREPNFGWSYPPGAANDPSAPWNQDTDPCCPFHDAGGDPLASCGGDEAEPEPQEIEPTDYYENLQEKMDKLDKKLDHIIDLFKNMGVWK